MEIFVIKRGFNYTFYFCLIIVASYIVIDAEQLF